LAKLAADADVRVEVATFEEWSAARPVGALGFDDLISGQAWHWTDPKTRWANAGAAVRSGGVVALFWNEDHHADPRVLEAFTAAYDRRGVDVRSVRREPRQTRTRSSKPRPVNGWPEVHPEADEYVTGVRTYQYHWTTGCRWPITWRASTPRRRT
jgi:hypothetical protein